MAVRTHIQSILAQRLGSHLTAEQCSDLEKGLYNAAIQDADRKGVRKHWDNPEFAELYKVASRRVIVNLDPTAYIGNNRLIQRLKENEFPAHRVPFMTAKELYPEHWQQMTDEQIKRENTMLEGDKEGGSDMFKCKRCGKSKTKYWEMQTRSADEPMTIFIRCLNCSKEWRQ
jgi:transcription elongation factor S-II